MNSHSTSPSSVRPATVPLYVIVAGAVSVVTEIVAVYLILLSWGQSELVAVGGAVATTVIIGGAYGYTVIRARWGGPTRAQAQKPFHTRLAELIVSISVITLLAAVAYLLGLLLKVMAMLGVPDPKVGDQRVSTRLLRWVGRNRDFMRENGTGTLPLAP